MFSYFPAARMLPKGTQCLRLLWSKQERENIILYFSSYCSPNCMENCQVVWHHQQNFCTNVETFIGRGVPQSRAFIEKFSSATEVWAIFTDCCWGSQVLPIQEAVPRLYYFFQSAANGLFLFLLGTAWIGHHQGHNQSRAQVLKPS